MPDEFGESTLIEKLDAVAPIQSFDAFPKTERTYRSSSSVGGIYTIMVALLTLMLVMNDLSEFFYGWPDYEFAVDTKVATTMVVNVDLIVNMPCHYLTVDLRDSVGDRLHLSSGFKRDGTLFDYRAAMAARTWKEERAPKAREVVAQSRRNRGLFAWLSRSKKREFPPTYNLKPGGQACRVYGSVEVKKVTANLHITTLGHGYGSNEHTDHSIMNLTHYITEFSFGPYIPDIVQPLDYSYEVTGHPFSIFQYFLTVVPTTYYASPKRSVDTNQYSVTHYLKEIQHNEGAPGIFFKFDIDPMAVAVHQRSTTFLALLVRIVGVVGGIWVCGQWAFKVGGKAAEIVVGKSEDDDETLVKNANASGRSKRWAGGSLSKRKGWDDISSPSPASPQYYPNQSSPYAGSFTSLSPQPGTPQSPYSPMHSPQFSPRMDRPHSFSSSPGSPSMYALPPSPNPSGSPMLVPPGSPALPSHRRQTSNLNPNRVTLGVPYTGHARSASAFVTGSEGSPSSPAIRSDVAPEKKDD